MPLRALLFICHLVTVISSNGITDPALTNCTIQYSSKKCNEWVTKCTPSGSTSSQTSLTTPERECLLSQMAIELCNTKYQNACPGLQAECISARWAPPVSQNANGAYKLSTAFRHCINEGGVFAVCTAQFGQITCNQWESRCATSLYQNPMGVYQTGNWYKLSPEVPLCIETQRLMKACIEKNGKQSCEDTLRNCERYFNAPKKMLPPWALYTMTNKLTNCVGKAIMS